MAKTTALLAFDKESAELTQQDLIPILASHERFAAGRGGQRAQLVRRKLDGLNFSNHNLTDADFAGASLVGATFFGSILKRASFYCTDLRGSNLQSVDLRRADMRGASFRGANLANSVLDGGDLRTARMMIVDGGDQSVTSLGGDRGAADESPQGVDFSNCSLRNASFGNVRFDNVDFTGAIMEGAKFRGAMFSNIRLKRAVLTGVDLKDLAVERDELEDCLFDVSEDALAKAGILKDQLSRHEQWIATDGVKGMLAGLDEEDLRPLHDFLAGRRLIALSARKAIAVGLSFAGSRLQAAKFDEADLRSADFSDCDLRGASFRGALLSHAKFSRARLGALKLASGGALTTNFAGAVVGSAQFDDAVVECETKDLGISLA